MACGILCCCMVVLVLLEKEESGHLGRYGGLLSGMGPVGPGMHHCMIWPRVGAIQLRECVVLLE